MVILMTCKVTKSQLNKFTRGLLERGDREHKSIEKLNKGYSSPTG